MPPNPPHIFVSYSHAQKAELKALLDELDVLVGEGHLTYWADTGLKPGDHWDDVIRAEVRKADVVVGLITTDWLKSPYVRTAELDGVKEGRQVFVGAVLEACTWKLVASLSKRQVLFPDEHLLDFDSRGQKKAWVKLAEAVHESATRAAAAEAARQTALHNAVLTLLNNRSPHLGVIHLTLAETRPGCGHFRATLDVGKLGPEFVAQWELVRRFADLRGQALTPADVPAPTADLVIESGDLSWSTRADGSLDPASLTFRSHLFEDLAAMLTLRSPAGLANGEDVKLPDYQIGKFPVTQALYKLVMGENPSEFEGDPARPVESVNWYNAVRFGNTLSKLTGREPAYRLGAEAEPAVTPIAAAAGFRLPSEAEFEVAHRAGSKTTYFWGEDGARAKEFAWFDTNSGKMTHPVGHLSDNAWHFHDTAGNVWEWCFDLLGRDSLDRVLRGGAFSVPARDLRSAARVRFRPGSEDRGIGFRCASLPSRAWGD